MPELGVVEDTLFIPMAGRIYASERFPGILSDKKALELKSKIPSRLLGAGDQDQYTLLASASRAANMDRIARDFVKRKPGGIVAQLGCGLETAFYRCDDGATRWYAIDLPDVIAFRRTLLPEPERETYLAADAFSDAWIERIRTEAPGAPVLVTAGGLFHYFEEDRVLGLLAMLKRSGDIEVAFDAVNRRGLDMMRRKYLRQMGHAEAQMHFCVDAASELATRIGPGTELLAEEPYYRRIPRAGLKLATRVSMTVSDALMMVKMVHLKL